MGERSTVQFRIGQLAFVLVLVISLTFMILGATPAPVANSPAGSCPEDPDQDGDGVCDNDDNCPEISNPDQTDADADGIGDLCDPCDDVPGTGPDRDGDFVCDRDDNCVGLSNPTQNSPVKLNGPLVTGGDVVSYMSSADGESVVYIADQDADGINELYRSPVDGGGAIKLNTTLIAGGNVADFRISPDSSRVVYRANVSHATDFDLLSVPIEGGASATLYADKVPADYEITPDGTTTVFRAPSSDPLILGFWALYAVPTEGGTAILIVQGGQNGDGGAVDFKISPDSQYVAYRVDSHLGCQNCHDFLGLRFLPPGGFVSGFGEVPFVYAFSPDSAHLVFFEEEACCGGHGIVRYDIADDREHVVTLGAQSPTDLRISPQQVDGSFQVVYYIIGNLRSVPLDGGKDISLSPDLVTAWVISEDGDDVVSITDTSPAELYRVRTTGGERTPLNDTLVAGGNVTNFSISRDSATVVYRADQLVDERFEVFAAPILGGAATFLNGTIPADGDVDGSFVIDSASSTVLYRADLSVDQQFEVFSVPIGGGSSYRVNDGLPPAGDVETDISASEPATHALYRADQDSETVTELYSAVLDTDADEDGHFDRCDCDTNDPSIWGTPSEVTALSLTHTGGDVGTTTLSWSTPLFTGGGSLAYDVLRTSERNGFASGGVAPIDCAESNGVDLTADDSETPTGTFFYIVRAENACGPGVIGFGREQGAATSCP